MSELNRRDFVRLCAVAGMGLIIASGLYLGYREVRQPRPGRRQVAAVGAALLLAMTAGLRSGLRVPA